MSTQVTNLPIPCDIGLQQQRFRVYVVAKIFWWEPPAPKTPVWLSRHTCRALTKPPGICSVGGGGKQRACGNY